MPANPVASAAYVVTPNDGADLPSVAFGLYIGTAGTLKVDCASEASDANKVTVTFPNVVQGILPLKVKRVYATGTSATNIVALEE
jgi:hypothetical protein